MPMDPKTSEFWFVSYRVLMLRPAHAAADSVQAVIDHSSNVLLAGIHPVIWLARTRDTAPTFAKSGGTRYLEFYAPLDEATFQAAAIQNYVECQDFRAEGQ
jgi:hypothetical protein